MAESIWNRNTEEALMRALRALTDSVKELSDNTKAQTAWFRSHVDSVTLRDLKEMENRMAEQIQKFGAATAAELAKVRTALGGLQGDITELNKKIQELQNSPGAITPQDQALLDAIEADAKDLATAFEALDTQTPPAPGEPPVEPPVEPPSEGRRNR